MVLLASATAGLSAGCAGGNAIDRAVPQAAFAESPAQTAEDFESGAAVEVSGNGQPGQNTIASDAAGDTVAEPSVLPPPSQPDPVFAGTGEIADTGQYPNLNIVPGGATAQMTDAERDALYRRMTALNAAHSGGNISPAEYRRRLAELRRLAATHSEQTIETIEKQAQPQ